MKTLSTFAIIICTVLLVGCDSSTTTDPTGTPSKVEFNYSGAKSGAFKVEGAYPSQKDGSGASSTLSSDRKVVTIKAIDWQTAESSADFIDITLSSKDPIQDNQVFTIGDANSTMAIVAGFGLAYPSFPATQAFYATTGSIVLTTVKDNQIKGTFEVGLTNQAGNNVGVTAGKFDVKY